MKKLDLMTVSVLLLAGLGFAQKQTDWINTSNSPEIQYRVQLFDDSKACYLEFRDKKQGKGYTTFDAAVDYKWMDPQSESQQSEKTKAETEHLVTAPTTQTASARISECSGVVEVKVNYIQRH